MRSREALSEVDRAAVITGWDGSPEALSARIITVTDPLREQGRLRTRIALHPDVAPVEWRILGAERIRCSGPSPPARLTPGTA